MASHHLAIAKASLAAAMMRPDPTPVARADISQLHTLLDSALEQCSPVNIQLCKAWILKIIISSAARITATGKYLVALSVSVAKSAEGRDESPDKRHQPSAGRKQLHILYLLNDLLHHTKYHLASSSTYSILTGTIQSHLVDLVGSAAAFDSKAFSKHHKRIERLLDIWEAHGYYQSSYVQKLRETATNAANLGYTGAGTMGLQLGDTVRAPLQPSRAGRNAPYVMPATHGDPSTPYYDLPAGNMMPHIIPGSTTPINPQLVKALQLVAGPADEKLVMAVKDFMKDVKVLLGTGEEHDAAITIDIDQLGQPIFRDDISGEPLGGEAYYGWSKAFCRKMKRREDDMDQQEPEPEPGPSAVKSVDKWPPRRPELAQKLRDEV